MSSYCLKCNKNTENMNQVVSKTRNGGAIILSKCANVVVKNQDLLKTKKKKDFECSYIECIT